jgi:hypothetical protein
MHWQQKRQRVRAENVPSGTAEFQDTRTLPWTKQMRWFGSPVFRRGHAD